MNSKQLTGNLQDEIKPKFAVVPVVAALAFGTSFIFYLRSKLKPKRMPTDPPPIIIKTGSFIIDSKKGFKKAGNVVVPGNPKRKKLNEYKGNFGPIKSLLINRVNTQWSYYFEDPKGITINLWLQKFNGTTNDWETVDIKDGSDVLIRPSKPLILELPEDLIKDNGSSPERPERDKFNTIGGNPIFRIGRITVRDQENYLMRYFYQGKYYDADFESRNGDEFYIALWDIYVP